MIDSFVDYFLYEWNVFVRFLPRLLFGLIIFIIFYGIGKFFGRIISKLLERGKLSITHIGFFQKLTVGVFLFIGFIFFLNILGYSTLAASFVAGGGLTAVMLGFAFKDIGENLLAGFFLAFSRPFNKGDLIESGGLTGRVQDIQLRHTHIRTSEGCDVFVPSSHLFTKPLHNYTLDGLRRSSFTIGIDYADDIRKAIDILLQTISTTKNVLHKPEPAVQIKGFNPDYVELQISVWINAKDPEASLPKVRTDAMEKCRIALIDGGFTFSSNVSTNVDLSKVNVTLNRVAGNQGN